MIKKVIAFFLLFCFIAEQSGFAQMAGQMPVPAYLSSFNSPDRFRPMHLRSIMIDPQTKFIDLILDKGDISDPKISAIEETTRKLLEYFRTGLVLPNSLFWVNLRPDSPKDVIDPYLENTDLGRVLLESDLKMKKDMAMFTSPDTREGRQYWDALYKKAEQIYGPEDITIPTLTRPWIVPGEIILGQSKDGVYIYKAALKVMLEQDYLKDSVFFSFEDERARQMNDFSSSLIRKLVIPKLTKEINSSKRYSDLRQVYYSLILAQWFKKRHEGGQSALAVKIDSRDMAGLKSSSIWKKESYYNEYKRSFNNGEYNRQEAFDGIYGRTIRSYFSGGMSFVRPDAMVPVPLSLPAGPDTVAVRVDPDTGRVYTVEPGRGADGVSKGPRDGGESGSMSIGAYTENALQYEPVNPQNAPLDISLSEYLRKINIISRDERLTGYREEQNWKHSGGETYLASATVFGNDASGMFFQRKYAAKAIVTEDANETAKTWLHRRIILREMGIPIPEFYSYYKGVIHEKWIDMAVDSSKSSRDFFLPGGIPEPAHIKQLAEIAATLDVLGFSIKMSGGILDAGFIRDLRRDETTIYYDDFGEDLGEDLADGVAGTQARGRDQFFKYLGQWMAQKELSLYYDEALEAAKMRLEKVGASRQQRRSFSAAFLKHSAHAQTGVVTIGLHADVTALAPIGQDRRLVRSFRDGGTADLFKNSDEIPGVIEKIYKKIEDKTGAYRKEMLGQGRDFSVDVSPRSESVRAVTYTLPLLFGETVDIQLFVLSDKLFAHYNKVSQASFAGEYWEGPEQGFIVIGESSLAAASSGSAIARKTIFHEFLHLLYEKLRPTERFYTGKSIIFSEWLSWILPEIHFGEISALNVRERIRVINEGYLKDPRINSGFSVSGLKEFERQNMRVGSMIADIVSGEADKKKLLDIFEYSLMGSFLDQNGRVIEKRVDTYDEFESYLVEKTFSIGLAAEGNGPESRDGGREFIGQDKLASLSGHIANIEQLRGLAFDQALTVAGELTEESDLSPEKARLYASMLDPRADNKLSPGFLNPWSRLQNMLATSAHSRTAVKVNEFVRNIIDADPDTVSDGAISVAGDADIETFPELLRDIIANWLTNGKKYYKNWDLAEKEPLNIAFKISESAVKGFVRIEYRDNGPGMREDVLEYHLTGRGILPEMDVQGGINRTGQGSLIILSKLDDLGGKYVLEECESTPGNGARLTIDVPVSGAPQIGADIADTYSVIKHDLINILTPWISLQDLIPETGNVESLYASINGIRSELDIITSIIPKKATQRDGGEIFVFSTEELERYITQTMDNLNADNIKRSLERLWGANSLSARNQNVPLTAIVPSSQPYINLEELGARIYESRKRSETETPVILIEMYRDRKLQFTVLDGHHRVAAAFIDDRQFVPAIVISALNISEDIIAKSKNLNRSGRSISQINVRLPDGRQLPLEEVKKNFDVGQDVLSSGVKFNLDGGVVIGTIGLKMGVFAVEDERGGSLATMKIFRFADKKVSSYDRLVFVKNAGSPAKEINNPRYVGDLMKLAVASTSADPFDANWRRSLGREKTAEVLALSGIDYIMARNLMVVEDSAGYKLLVPSKTSDSGPAKVEFVDLPQSLNDEMGLFLRLDEMDWQSASRAVKAAAFDKNSFLKKIALFADDPFKKRDEQTKLSGMNDGGQLQEDNGKGGIDFRNLPAFDRFLNVSVPVVPAALPDSVSGVFDEQWDSIQKKIRSSGSMPYDQIREYILACKKENALQQANRALLFIAKILRMEEEQAVPTAKEIKEILIAMK